ncbi:lysylphosphatidylglycerol synthase transmembrane domain-containing protein [Nocardioides sp. Iso805N]|uniref:lysylphosphatidylglycerol synthase transmembrane domain-containing protein n=1 Tax=Nocardioides sp. Iso805N TaxID=1283287 RepID=UPI000376D8C5|nr:lysylphosphatidylglycerol synthase transmembrane domain-containing protein [Nocardioides sp. Iso805N]
MIISPALSAELALLTQALDLPGVDVAETLTRLAADSRTAAGSYLGLSVAITADRTAFAFTVLDDGVRADHIRSSLLVPLTVAPDENGAVDATTSPASLTLIFYAATPGAFIDLAADLAWLTGLALSDVRLDEHRTLPPSHTPSKHLRAMATINQALGVLIGQGATPDQAERDLAARAAEAGIDLPAVATLVLAALQPTGPAIARRPVPEGVSSRRWWAWLRRIGLMLVALALIEYLAVPQILRASHDLTLLTDAEPWLLVVALALELCSLASYTALTRVVLPAGVRPGFLDQFRIDLTGLGASHVLPGGGASAAALRFRLMTRWGVPAQEAASTAAVETALVLIGLVATFAGGVALAGTGIVNHPGYAAAGTAAALVLILVGLGMWSVATRPNKLHRRSPQRLRAPSRVGTGSERAWQVIAHLASTVAETARATAGRAVVLIREPDHRIPLFGWALGNWLFDAASLWVCLRAYGIDLHPGALLMAYGAANLLGLLPVTPGGLAIVEGVLIPAVVALGDVSVAPATLGVLTWRLFEFWLPIPISGLTYLSLRVQGGLPDKSGAA